LKLAVLVIFFFILTNFSYSIADEKSKIIEVLNDTKNLQFNFEQIKNISNGQKKIIDHIYQLPKIIKISSETYSPSLISQFTYDLSKLYNAFYQEEKIIDGNNNETTSFKIALSHLTSIIIKNSLELLGIDVPKKM